MRLFVSLISGMAAANPSPEALHAAIAQHRHATGEFRALAELGATANLRVFLFGGTASTFAHHVRSEPESFAFEAIYADTQDLDIVVTRVDGTPETEAEIEAFERKVVARFPYLRGRRTKWEVRGLKTAHGSKEPLLGNPDFIRQHSDSHSTGLIELTEVSKPVVRDLREWRSETPKFLRDAAAARNTFYFEATHEDTPRARAGTNPPIIAAIRYLIKAFQHGLEIDARSAASLGRIIGEFQPGAPLNPIALEWIRRNGLKLVKNARDLEAAWNALETLGLRRKLIALDGAFADPNSLAVWLDKEPLRSEAGHIAILPSALPMHSRTAGEMGIERVTHETKDFAAYEAITASPNGRPSAFISRAGHPGEQAGQAGFYTCEGIRGARNTGFHIRLRVDPSAREGVDFIYQPAEGDDPAHVVWLTSHRLTVIREGSRLQPSEALEYLLDPTTQDDRGIQQRVLKLAARRTGDAAERARFLNRARAAIEHRRFPVDGLKLLFSFGLTLEIPEIFDLLKPDFDAHPGVAAVVFDRVRDQSPEKFHPIWRQWFDRPAALYAHYFRDTDASEIAASLSKVWPAPDAFIAAWREAPAEHRPDAASLLRAELEGQRNYEQTNARHQTRIHPLFFTAPHFFDLPGTRAIARELTARDPAVWEQLLTPDLTSPDPEIETRWREWITADPAHAFIFCLTSNPYVSSRALPRILNGQAWRPSQLAAWRAQTRALMTDLQSAETESLQRRLRGAQRDSDRKNLGAQMQERERAVMALFLLPPALRPPELEVFLFDRATPRWLIELGVLRWKPVTNAYPDLVRRYRSLECHEAVARITPP